MNPSQLKTEMIGLYESAKSFIENISRHSAASETTIDTLTFKLE